MTNPTTFCTCTDTSCPFHPTNHDKGCTPCIAKNLKQNEIPTCFFKKADSDYKGPEYTFEDFARTVIDSKIKDENQEADTDESRRIRYYTRYRDDKQHLYKYDESTDKFFFMDHCWTGKGVWFEREFPSFNIIEIDEDWARELAKGNLKGS